LASLFKLPCGGEVILLPQFIFVSQLAQLALAGVSQRLLTSCLIRHVAQGCAAR